MSSPREHERPTAEGAEVRPASAPPAALYACLYRPPVREGVTAEGSLARIAEQASPRYELHGDDLVSIDIRGLDRMLGGPKVIAEYLRRDAAARDMRVHVAIAATRTTAMVLARFRPGMTVVKAGDEAAALAGVPLWVLLRTVNGLERSGEKDRRLRPSELENGEIRERGSASVRGGGPPAPVQKDARLRPCDAEDREIRSGASASVRAGGGAPAPVQKDARLRPCDAEDREIRGGASASVRAGGGPPAPVQRRDAAALGIVEHWGIRTLGELAALPAAELVARLGTQGAAWQAIARGEDTRPLVPARPDERFDASIALEWPIDELEPLSFVLTRLLEPLSTRLEQADRGVAVLHVALDLVTKDAHVRRLELPTPIREVRALRTLALIDLEAHPPAAAIDRVTITIDPTPGRIWQYALFARPHPTPEQLSTLLARLGALMGQDRVGTAVQVDTYRPGAFAMRPFALEHGPARSAASTRAWGATIAGDANVSPLVSALRRCRQPVAARVAVDGDGRPLRVATDRRGWAGGAVTASAGPWRTSGEWWEMQRLRPSEREDLEIRARGSASVRGGGGPPPPVEERERLRPSEAEDMEIRGRGSASVRAGGGPPALVQESERLRPWDRDEWDVALSDGVVYRIFRDRPTSAWFIDGVVD